MTDTEVGELLVLVVKMRRWQRTFFRSRDQRSLLRAKDYEQQVDQRLRAWVEAAACAQEESPC